VSDSTRIKREDRGDDHSNAAAWLLGPASCRASICRPTVQSIHWRVSVSMDCRIKAPPTKPLGGFDGAKPCRAQGLVGIHRAWAGASGYGYGHESCFQERLPSLDAASHTSLSERGSGFPRCTLNPARQALNRPSSFILSSFLGASVVVKIFAELA